MKKDIQTKADIIKMVDQFYELVKKDSLLGPIFTDVSKVDWVSHLPKMYDFWENILFYSANYSGSPMAVHKELHQKSTMTQEHFQHWNALFNQTVDKLFEGAKADEIKNRAMNISAVMMYKTLT